MIFLQAQTISFIEKCWLTINTYDQYLFIYINRIWTSTVLDSFFPIWGETISWAPLYLFLLIFSLINFGVKAWPWLLFFLVTLTMADLISNLFFEKLFDRVRPCKDLNLLRYVRLLLSSCPNGGSFTSSHAASHFGAAVFISITLEKYINKWRYLFFFWAFFVSYAQVYIGVHYPLDVIGGALLGCIIGYGIGGFFIKKIGLPEIEPSQELPNIIERKL
jgi:membrane-associated phospholipid phosphatase